MIEHHRQSVPALQQKMNGKALVYCDWAATAQMPQCVLDVVFESMQLRGNVRRGVHNLGAESTRLSGTSKRYDRQIHRGTVIRTGVDLWHHAWSKYARTVCWRDVVRGGCCHPKCRRAPRPFIAVAENVQAIWLFDRDCPPTSRGNIDLLALEMLLVENSCSSHGVSDDLQCNWKPSACGRYC